MNYDLDIFIERLVMIAFFSGYPLVYAIIKYIVRQPPKSKDTFGTRVFRLLPFSYALISTLFLGLVLRDLYTSYILTKAPARFPLLFYWGMLGILFWIPTLAKKPVLSLLHSLVFFLLLLQDLVLINRSAGGKETFHNEMKMYTVSLLLNTVALTVIVLIQMMIRRYKKEA